MIEQLTKAERDAIECFEGDLHADIGGKALRLIDAQAATLAKVRAVYEYLDQKTEDTRDTPEVMRAYSDAAVRIEAALDPAAPAEPTEFEDWKNEAERLQTGIFVDLFDAFLALKRNHDKAPLCHDCGHWHFIGQCNFPPAVEPAEPRRVYGGEGMPDVEEPAAAPDDSWTCADTDPYDGKPEKIAGLLRDLAAANARIAGLNGAIEVLAGAEQRADAANMRAEAANAEVARLTLVCTDVLGERRKAEQSVIECKQAISVVTTERDQLKLGAGMQREALRMVRAERDQLKSELQESAQALALARGEAANEKARADKLTAALNESAAQSDDEMRAIRLAQDIIEAHNVNVSKLATAETRIAELEIELQLRAAEHEAANAELRRRIVNQAASHDMPRLQEVAEIHGLKARLAELEAYLADLPTKQQIEADIAWSEQGRALLEECTNHLVPNWPAIERSRTFLSGQPAAPNAQSTANPPDTCKHCGLGIWNPDHHRIHQAGWYCQGKPAAPTRAEAEQAVLDAMGEVPVQGLHQWRRNGSVLQSNVAVAELARRGLK